MAGWSSLEDRPRYTPSTVFSTFPWPPDPSRHIRQQVAAAAREVVDIRGLLCREHRIGLTTLYNHLEEGAFAGLFARHRALDRALATAYGWPMTALNDPPEQINRRLLDLNLAIARGEQAYLPFSVDSE